MGAPREMNCAIFVRLPKSEDNCRSQDIRQEDQEGSQGVNS